MTLAFWSWEDTAAWVLTLFIVFAFGIAVGFMLGRWTRG